jgi:Sorting nexin C terminal/PX domain
MKFVEGHRGNLTKPRLIFNTMYFCRKNVEAEATIYQPSSRPPSRPASSHNTSMPPPPPRMHHHARSRSHDGLIQTASAAVAAIDGAVPGGFVGIGGRDMNGGGAAGGPPEAHPARFWSGTQQTLALSSQQQQQEQGQKDGLGGGSVKTATAATTSELSSDSVTSRASSMSATSPVRLGPHGNGTFSTDEGHIEFPVPVGTTNTIGGGGGFGDEGSETTSLMRPSPFHGDSSASFMGLVGAPPGVEQDKRLFHNGAAAAAAAAPVTFAGVPESAGCSELTAEECCKRPSPADSLPGFIGLPRARVVAADLNTSGAKDFVVYKIRVGDDSGREWTVSRRYRHFEVLHRQLRGTAHYKSKLPAKRIFIHTQSEDFVEDRRNALDMYLQEVLNIPYLARSGDVWEFLRSDSERFEVPGVGGSYAGGGGQLKRGLSRTVLAGASSVGRGVVGAAVDVTRGVTLGVNEVRNAAVDGVGAVLNEARSGFAGLRHRRSSSVPEDLQDFDPSTANFGFHGSRTMNVNKKGDPLSRAGTGLLRTATASARKVRQALKSQPSLSQHQYDVAGNAGVYGEDEESIQSGAARALQFGVSGGATAATAGVSINNGEGGGGPSRSESSSGNILRTSRSSSPQKFSKGSNVPRKGSNSRPSRGTSPVKNSRRGGAGDLTTTSASEGYYGVAERAAAFAPGYQPGNVASNAAGVNEKTGGLIDPVHVGGLGGNGLGISLYNEIDDFGATSPPFSADSYNHRGGHAYGVNYGGGSTSSSPLGGGGGYNNNNTHPLLRSSTNSASQMDLEACTGISAPLYELVDCVFQLQTRGFFRRQVYAVARQVLSMAIGDAIDVYLLAKLSLLRQESTIGGVIQLIQTSLWPGGIWFQRTAQFKALHPDIPQEELRSPTPAGGSMPAPPPGMQPENYLTPAGTPPLDEEEVREAVWELLLRKAPSPLLRLVGKTAYTEGVQDLYEMIQSPTFMKQLGYGLLEISALHLCPELKGLFQNLESNPNL